ncbi:replication protein A, subunit RPA32 [Aulographum hederae CBS 113979]|uniref:Replication protein A, subunit RPA32 n=1 Tax=Aulographum hederae CBS 113979 TaxID=1176131 RepID=A0A6G1H877_9PEZI|nr:replication protein A, subunit RPA32 [Aulographum hederae CBS 113979]
MLIPLAVESDEQRRHKRTRKRGILVGWGGVVGDNNYSTTSYSAGGGGGGGGFVQGGSQTSPAAQRTSRNDTLRPVTVKQLIDAQVPHHDQPFQIDGADVGQVTLVGQVRNVSVQTTNTTYRIDDGTGTIEVKQWQDAEGDNSMKPKIAENSYVRAWGNLKSFNDKKHIGAHIIRPVEDFNEVNYHLLEATAVHLHFTRGPPNGAKAQQTNASGYGQQAQQGGYAGNGMSNMNGGGSGLPSGFSAAASKVYTFLKNTPQTNEGLHRDEIAHSLGMEINEVARAGDDLLSGGQIFTTVDDYTWAPLETD